MNPVKVQVISSEQIGMLNVLRDLLAKGGYTIAEDFVMPSSEARYRPIPQFLFESSIGSYLQHSKFGEMGLWNHQALALEKLGQEKNVVVSTGTASGKSLIFRTISFHQIMLHPERRVLVFYPLKALATDQLKGWRTMAMQLGLDPEMIGRIDGSVSVRERDEILEKARILVMTPDVCHAWMMSRLSIPLVKNFLTQLTYIVIDEAHTLEGVFGSNFAFLMRRILAARRFLGEKEKKIPFRIIASTATISKPADHMKSLSGMDFETVTEDDDGSPHYERYCAHVVAPSGEEIQMARILQTELLKHSQEGGFITFVDSRKGVELLARSSQSALEEFLGNDVVMPYRAGYDSIDREKIEHHLQSGLLRGVVSTSALELGIDLPHLSVGMNVGVPPSRKAYRQRLGRVGRSNMGAFLIIAHHNAFKEYGTSFKEYHDMSVEPSHLYLDNRFMQFAHARCLIDEVEALGANSNFIRLVPWPETFWEIYLAAKPGGNIPPEFDAIAQLGGDAPQRSYPLRNIGELNFKIARGEHVEAFGEVTESQALYECYPGATYLHMGKAFDVISWHTSAFHPYIKVKPSSTWRQTKPRIKTWINTGIMPSDLIDNHFKKGNNGFLAECHMQITEKVEGYCDETGEYSYQTLRQRNPNFRSRQRNFRTSGVLLCIQSDWFKVRGVKQQLADWISAVFCREHSILPQDIGASATNISVRTLEGGGSRGDCLVLFDQTYGSLRLTEQLFKNFPVILDRLRISADSKDEAIRKDQLYYVQQLEEIYSGFQDFQDTWLDGEREVVPSSCIRVFTPGSVVFHREAGQLGTDVEVIQPTWMNGQMMYQVRLSSGVKRTTSKRWVSEHVLKPSADADAWSYGWWNPETEEFVDPDRESLNCELLND